MSIVKATVDDAELVASIISESNKDVAVRFDLNKANNPKHPSFCNKDWVMMDFNRGVEYFFYEENGEKVGCIAFENPEGGLAYLNRLGVLPESRQHGVGEQLVHHVQSYAKEQHIKTISLGIIASFDELKAWYEKLGFQEGETKHYPHLPFDVTYMTYEP